MPLKIYNSLTKQKEEFIPLKSGEVSMYVCGPTVYDEPHIGHLRSAYVFDVIRRYFEYSKYKVKFVRNVTDVDDKIIEKARENGADLLNQTRSLSKKYFDAYKSDLVKLGIKEPSIEPFATEHIQDMIFLIQQLIGKGTAYVSGGDVYFSVDGFESYGKLSHQKKDAMQESVRIDANEKKKAPLDFTLWKSAKEGEPAWDSPWGKGRPGWHIECSAMSMKYLGASFDIHGGGRDLIFPHHENEIAQSEGVTGQAFVKYWIHHGLITVDNQKMSKSLKNYITLSDVESKYGASADQILKLIFLGTNYGSPLDLSEEKFAMERQLWKRFFYFFEEAWRYKKEGYQPDSSFSGSFLEMIKQSMDNDFNTLEVIAAMMAMMRYARKKSDSSMIGAVIASADTIKKLGKEIFGLFDNLDEYFESDPNQKKLETTVNAKIKERFAARNNKDYQLADEIRSSLLKDHGVELVDLPDNSTKWRVRI